MDIVIPDWLPDGAAESAKQILSSKKSGSLQFARVERLIYGSKKFKKDAKKIKKLWNTLKESARKKAKEKDPSKSDEQIKADVDDALYMYFNLAVHGDGFHRKADLRRATAKNTKVKQQRIATNCRKIIKDLVSPRNANSFLTDILHNLNEVITDNAYDVDTRMQDQELIVEVREAFPILRALPTMLEMTAQVMEKVAKVNFKHPDTLPKYKTDTEIALHFVRLLKKHVNAAFADPLTTNIRQTLELVFDGECDISEDTIRKA